MTYNFDEINDRRHTNSENVDGWRPYIFHCGPDRVFPYKDEEFIRMWVADMEFAVAPEIRQAIIDRVNRPHLDGGRAAPHGGDHRKVSAVGGVRRDPLRPDPHRPAAHSHGQGHAGL